MRKSILAPVHLLPLLAVGLILVATGQQELPAGEQLSGAHKKLTPEQQAALGAVDVRLDRVEALASKIEDPGYQATVARQIENLKERRLALETNFDPALHESLMHRVISRYQVIALWLKPPDLPPPAPTAVGAVNAQPLAADEGDNERKFDVVVYGATPGGIAAAIPIARRNSAWRIAVVTRYQRVGGMTTNGLTHPDFRTFEARTGLFREFNRRVRDYYSDRFGVDSPQRRDSLDGTHAGPEVNHTVFRQMLDLPGIEVLTQHRLKTVCRIGSRINSAVFRTPNSEVTLQGKYYVDATYEGDLMAAAGVKFRVGREAAREYGETLAPETADNQVQGYNFRLTMTDVAANRALIPQPEDYDREDYLGLLPLLDDGSLPYLFGDPFSGKPGGIYKRQTPKLPNGKRDINDVSHGIVRLSLPNANNEWANGGQRIRQRIFAEHLRHNVGMLYFLQHDREVPDTFQDEARTWGLCRDEFTFNRHLPEQLYVREARRMVGKYVFTQHDVERKPGTGHARAVFHPDSIAMGDYGPNCHGTFHEGPLYGGRHTGEFYQPAAPYQIPYGVILPRELSNLAVPVACSSSHVGFCALRLEPIWMSLGQAAGEAIALALAAGSSLDDVTPEAIRERLHSTGAATIYTSDIPEESPDFPAVQWWGSLGGFVALDRTADDAPAEYGKRGEHRIGQYYHAFPEHRVEMEKELDSRIRREWLNAAEKAALSRSSLRQARTRGDFIRQAWSLRRRGHDADD